MNQTVIGAIRKKYKAENPTLDERGRRLWVAKEALALGRGGVVAVAQATGVARTTIFRGIKELTSGQQPRPGQIRKPGGGRKPLTKADPKLLMALEKLLDPAGRAESPLRWTCKSTDELAATLSAQGHPVSRTRVAGFLKQMGFSLQNNRMTRKGSRDPDRNAQFEYINRQVSQQVTARQPALYIDIKANELWMDSNPPRHEPDAQTPAALPAQAGTDRIETRVSPQEFHAVMSNARWVSVGVNPDTAGGAVAAIHRWWFHSGSRAYNKAQSLLITCNPGGSIGSHLWRWDLQRLADATRLPIHVCHLPPGTCKWNRIERRCFLYICQNDRCRKLTSHAVELNLMGTIHAPGDVLDLGVLHGSPASDQRPITLANSWKLHLVPEAFRGDWNYWIKPS